MKKYILVLLICIGALGIFAFINYMSFYDGKLHVIVCDVGQGDGILIKTPSNKLVIVDAGPDESMLSCLSDHVPFWQKTIDVFILSHPHSDHFMGMFSVLPVFTVKSYVSEMLVNRSVAFSEFQKALQYEGVSPHYLKKGDMIQFGDGVIFTVLGPSASFLKSTSPNGEIGNTGEFASLIVRIEYNNFSILLTGDSQVSGLQDALGEFGELGRLGSVGVLHVPHHGSRFGLDTEVISRLDPTVAVISVGENSYGHPTKEILGILRDEHIRIVRTDEMGDIKITTDGTSYSVEP